MKPHYQRIRRPNLETLEDKLVFILTYVRMYPLLFTQGILFNLGEQNACVWVHRLLPMLDEALGFTHSFGWEPRSFRAGVKAGHKTGRIQDELWYSSKEHIQLQSAYIISHLFLNTEDQGW